MSKTPAKVTKIMKSMEENFAFVVSFCRWRGECFYIIRRRIEIVFDCSIDRKTPATLTSICRAFPIILPMVFVHYSGIALTLISEFLRPSPSAFSGKNPESSLVTPQLGLRK